MEFDVPKILYLNNPWILGKSRGLPSKTWESKFYVGTVIHFRMTFILVNLIIIRIFSFYKSVSLSELLSFFISTSS